MDKVIKNGKVAVLYSPGYGAGWYSWNKNHKEILFHPKIVGMVEQGKQSDIDDEWMKENIGINIYTGGAEDLKIEWVKSGRNFRIDEYDGYESIEYLDDIETIEA